MAQLTAHAPEISCEGCANAIQRSLGKVEGVRNISVDVPQKDIRVEYDENAVQPNQILERLSKAGFDSELK